ncbi:hypothetical protein EVAR_7306_1 [Eumeta japonica]|uniref:Uncharacterized protein n=1 Tax=Eumeta variegata TaxID=151549 RepID=A0A4C1T2L7_EUMVA|nr:hypothetical protein EVAR_7306_1 [Eumeta japonica]
MQRQPGQMLCVAAVSLPLGRIGRWSGREIDASQAEHLGRSCFSNTRSALSLARSAQAERDNESCFYVRAAGVHRFIRRYHVNKRLTLPSPRAVAFGFVQIGTVTGSGIRIESRTTSKIKNGTTVRIEGGTGTEIENKSGGGIRIRSVGGKGLPPPTVAIISASECAAAQCVIEQKRFRNRIQNRKLEMKWDQNG